MTGTPRPVRVLVLGASLRKESFNVRLAGLAARTAAAHGASVTTVDYASLAVPPLDTDLLETDGVPEGARRFGALLNETDGFILAAPEYNYSVSGVLKNLIDWTSRIRPWPFIGRHALLLSASTGAVGGVRGLWALRVPLEGLGTHVYPDMFPLADAASALTAGDDLADQGMGDRLSRIVGGFLDLTEAAHQHVPARRRGRTE
ncbi:NAD(P)H-dependent oxidoreductase [Actinomadura sp. DC4]|uniref:NADPH-dependent FMN reductase n=1 Tax=Actinomadura sp. DC4 TaxID=3055069 RepID=UPI0025B13101|nr:NAD(P)H-dependent oxidoreductase [Actinomadura sp. DC4]MDN3351235.1 NAD(P)H-dependent oxidoreductase [Actinomadura sp. DC4]